MKTPNVYNLIQSLSEEEYSLCLKMFVLGKRTTALLELFEQMRQTTNPNDVDGIKDKLPSNTVKYYSQYCAKLSDYILNILRSNIKSKDVERLLIEYIDNCIVLIDKRLFEHAQLYLKKAQELISEHQHFSYQPILKYLSSILNIKNFRYSEQEDILEILESLNHSHQFSVNHSLLMHLQLINIFYYNKNNIPEKILSENKILEGKLSEQLNFDFINETDSLLIEHVKLNALKAVTRTDWQVALISFNKLTKLFNKKPNLKHTEIESYWANLNNSIQCMTKLKDFTNFKEIEKLLNKCISDYEDKLDPNAFVYKQLFSYITILYAYNSMGNIDEAKTYIPRITHFFNDKYLRIIEPILAYANYHITYHYFIKEKYSQALEWNNKTFEVIDQKQNNRYFFASRIIELLIYSELGEVEILNSLFRSFSRGKWTTYRDKNIDQIFKKVLLHTAKRKDKSLPLEKYNLMVETLERQSYSKYYFDSFDIVAWITSKKDETSFQNTLQKMY